ncbi:hypothetical protein FisN_20Hh277 [Fistulifera solaris]|uniref:Uncharacterized protein n=1 Tax=Fistulifera solaris TaxID=1519565 RepID=A0A1Z5JQ10_FISSO|nr:hypothetical protein FisN_20Hh277 [Fistulifera solaris]|eukprot:GAX16049.1 hypothetical protein FisN_20Hh277 [Fistulifera solaris]
MRLQTLRRISALATKRVTRIPIRCASVNLQDYSKAEHEKLMVRMSIQKLLEVANDDESPNEEKLYELERSLLAVQSRLEEAQLCICDCQDVANIDSIDEELRTADMALEAVGAAMVDFLEASRDMDETQRLKDVRKEYVTRFKGLRNQLEELVRQHRCEEVAR